MAKTHNTTNHKAENTKQINNATNTIHKMRYKQNTTKQHAQQNKQKQYNKHNT